MARAEDEPRLGRQWSSDRPMDVHVLGTFHRWRVQVHFRDGIFVVGRRAYDQSQVGVRPTANPRRLRLQLQTGLSVRERTLAFESAAQCTQLHEAISRWLRNELDYRESEDEEPADTMLRWEASRTQAEEELRTTMLLTMLVLCRRLFGSPAHFALFLLACICFGLGMVRHMLNDLWARQDGAWFAATCEIDREHFEAEAMQTVNSGVLWKVVGTYEVTVLFMDGCDGGLWRSVAGEGAAGGAHGARKVSFFESFDISEGDETPADVLDLDLELAPDLGPEDAPPQAAAAARGGRGPGARGKGEPATAGLAQPRGAARPANASCSPEHNAFLDLLRGDHVAYRRLVLDYDDFCYGPKGRNRSVALAHCNTTHGLWMQHRYPVGAHAPCYVFARPRGDGSLEAHVVMNRAIPWDVRVYLAYWCVLALFFVWLCALTVVRWLQRLGLLPPSEDEALSAESKDMLSLAGGVGQPGSRLAAQVEGMYAQSSVAGAGAGGAPLGQRRGSEEFLPML